MNGNASQGEEFFVDPISPWVLALDLTFTLTVPVGPETLLVAAPNNQEEPLETPVASRQALRWASHQRTLLQSRRG